MRLAHMGSRYIIQMVKSSIECARGHVHAIPLAEGTMTDILAAVEWFLSGALNSTWS